MARIGDNTIECWNCGKDYDEDEHEQCPACEAYHDDNPELRKCPDDAEIDSILEEDDIDDN
jgi:Zn finger protein HypA/HybF involved in hydrogenase expression